MNLELTVLLDFDYAVPLDISLGTKKNKFRDFMVKILQKWHAHLLIHNALIRNDIKISWSYMEKNMFTKQNQHT